MASGRSRAQEKNPLPGKSHTAVNHARLTPKNAVPRDTPKASQKVFATSSASVVSTRCCHTSPAGAKSEETTVPTGISTSVAMKTGIRRQPTELRTARIDEL